MSEKNDDFSSVALIGDPISVGRVQMHLIRHFGPASIQGTSGFVSNEGNGRVLDLKMPQGALNSKLPVVGTGDPRISHSLQEVEHKGNSILAMVLT